MNDKLDWGLKRLPIISAAGLCAWLLTIPSVQQNTMMFILVGAIPGTAASVPPLIMLIGWLAALGAIILWLSRQKFYAKERSGRP